MMRSIANAKPSASANRSPAVRSTLPEENVLPETLLRTMSGAITIARVGSTE